MSWQFNQDDNTYRWINDGLGEPNQPAPDGTPAPGNATNTTNTTNTNQGTTNTVATTAGRWHPDMPVPTWPQYPSGSLSQYGLGYANLADQILGAHQRPDALSSSWLYGMGAGRNAYAQGMGDGKAFPKNAGRGAPWLGNGLFPSFAGQPTAQPAGGAASGGLLGSGGSSQPVPSTTVNGKPPTKDATGLLGSTTNGGGGSATNANYIPGVNLAWGNVPSVGDPLNQYGGPTGRDLGHLWGQTYQEDGPSGYQGPVTNMSQARYMQYLSDLAAGATRDETTGMAYINGQPYNGGAR